MRTMSEKANSGARRDASVTKQTTRSLPVLMLNDDDEPPRKAYRWEWQGITTKLIMATTNLELRINEVVDGEKVWVGGIHTTGSSGEKFGWGGFG